MNRKTLLISVSLLIITAAAAAVLYRHYRPASGAAAEAAIKYHCPMHPTYISDKPGECPICGMNLVPIETPKTMNMEKPAAAQKPEKGERKIKFYRSPMDPKVTSPTPAKDEMGMDFVPVYEDEEAGAPEPGAFKVSSSRRQEIGLKTAMAMRRAFSVEIRAQGRVAYDPELYRTQQEYLSALTAAERAKNSTLQGSADRAKDLLASSRLRLRLLGMSDAQIDALAAEGKPDESLLLASGGGSLWLYADVYEADLASVKEGQTAGSTTPSLPGEEFTGKIISIDPVLDPKTRSARIRARLADPKGLLKPDMYLNTVIHAALGQRLAVPSDAVVDTGEKQVVFVDLGDGYLSARRITAGARSGDYVEVLKGLKAGDRVVTSGNFLIDSESQLKAAISGFGKEE